MALWTPPPDFNSRWVIWRRETGGARTDAYVVWISKRWNEFDLLNGGTPTIRSEENHRAFDAWLLERARMTGPVPSDFTSTVDFWCAFGPTELSDRAAIYLDSDVGGDPHIICTIERIHRPDDLKALCRLSSVALGRQVLDSPPRSAGE